MKTTVDLPDGLYRRARVRAAERGTTLRAIITESLEQALAGAGAAQASLPKRDRFTVDDRGWPVLRRSPTDSTIVTDDLVERLRREEGV